MSQNIASPPTCHDTENIRSGERAQQYFGTTPLIAVPRSAANLRSKYGVGHVPDNVLVFQND
jgi:hypothetical protein